MSIWIEGDTPPQTARTVLAYVGAGTVATAYYEYKKWVWSGGHSMTAPPLYWRDVLDLLKEVHLKELKG